MKKLATFLSAIVFLSIEIFGQSCTECGGTTNTGSNSSAIGTNTISSGNSSFASGFGSEATYNYTTALGFFAKATYTKSIALGSAVKASMDRSVVIGSGSYNNGIYLENLIPRSLMVGFNSQLPTLFISESPQSPWYDKTGKVGIGNVTNPLAKLHIKADEGEDAALFVEPYIWGLGSEASFYLGNTGHGLKAHSNQGLIFNTESYYSFDNGPVGIGTRLAPPQAQLEVVGDVMMDGFNLRLNPVEGYVLTCTSAEGSGQWMPLKSLWSVNLRGDIYRQSKVGIGVEEPIEMLDVDGDVLINDAITGRISEYRGWNDPDFLTINGSNELTASKIAIPKGSNPEHNALKIINPSVDGGIQFHNEGIINFNIRRDDVVIGRPDHEMEVKVNGKIWTYEVEVMVTDWWDDVFKEEYRLMPLNELECFIQNNQHLPDVPTEEEVLENGIELGEMNALLLKKVEEVTLYVIELNSEIEELKTQKNNSSNQQ